jgi:hypothetical protein
MPRSMFNDICQALAAHSDVFKLTYDGCGKAGFATVQKVTAAVRMLAYGGAADSLDEYIRMGQSTILQTLWHSKQRILRSPSSHFPNASAVSLVSC